MDHPLYIGSNGHVCAIDPHTGAELWRTRLQQGVFNATTSADVSILVQGDILFAGSHGHLFALNTSSGEILWHNELSGLGYNDISLAIEGVSVQFLQKTERSNSSST
jgi:outer membrane protein assembly factor BamB